MRPPIMTKKILESDDENESARKTRATSRGASGLMNTINVDRIINERFENDQPSPKAL